MKIKPGHEQQALEAVQAAYGIAHGFLGWSGQARMMDGLGLFKVPGKKRIRIKKIKRLLQASFWQNIMEHVEEEK